MSTQATIEEIKSKVSILDTKAQDYKTKMEQLESVGASGMDVAREMLPLQEEQLKLLDQERKLFKYLNECKYTLAWIYIEKGNKEEGLQLLDEVAKAMNGFDLGLKALQDENRLKGLTSGTESLHGN